MKTGVQHTCDFSVTHQRQVNLAPLAPLKGPLFFTPIPSEMTFRQIWVNVTVSGIAVVNDPRNVFRLAFYENADPFNPREISEAGIDLAQFIASGQVSNGWYQTQGFAVNGEQMPLNAYYYSTGFAGTPGTGQNFRLEINAKAVGIESYIYTTSTITWAGIMAVHSSKFPPYMYAQDNYDLAGYF